ncbi:MAG: 1-acyl-sn-glycerol-3-phosphate acyltransferase [Phycisphaerales bacterium]|nr:MAG: 1-acyl-sn-glycerol-3-phosphate acyltransferase [Phycisphaerales bacterium]
MAAHPEDACERQARSVHMRWSYRLCRAIVRAAYVLWACGRVYGTDHVPRTGGVVLACNHQSFLDPMLATLALPRECSYMARDTLFRNPVFRRVIELFNAFPVRRGESDVAAMRASLQRLADGALITAFPEGTRTADGRVRPCRPGVVVLARKAKVPLVPVAIEGAFEAWPRHRRFPGRANILVEYGRPLSPRELAAAGRDESAKRLTAEIRTIHNRLRRRAGKPPFIYGD